MHDCHNDSEEIGCEGAWIEQISQDWRATLSHRNVSFMMLRFMLKALAGAAMAVGRNVASERNSLAFVTFDTAGGACRGS
jgi:hypothetical protein